MPELFRVAITGTQAEGLLVAVVRFAAFVAVVAIVCFIGSKTKE